MKELFSAYLPSPVTGFWTDWFIWYYSTVLYCEFVYVYQYPNPCYHMFLLTSGCTMQDYVIFGNYTRINKFQTNKQTNNKQPFETNQLTLNRRRGFTQQYIHPTNLTIPQYDINLSSSKKHASAHQPISPQRGLNLMPTENWDKLSWMVDSHFDFRNDAQVSVISSTRSRRQHQFTSNGESNLPEDVEIRRSLYIE